MSNRATDFLDDMANEKLNADTPAGREIDAAIDELAKAYRVAGDDEDAEAQERKDRLIDRPARGETDDDEREQSDLSRPERFDEP